MFKTLINPSGLGTGLRPIPLLPVAELPTTIGLFGPATLCPAGLALALCSSTTGSTIQLYGTSGDANSLCYTPQNPHVARVVTPVVIYQGSAIVKRAILTLGRQKYADTDDQIRQATLFTSVTIPLGSWAILSYNGAEIKGMVVKCDRDVPGMVTVHIDTAKALPFRKVT